MPEDDATERSESSATSLSHSGSGADPGVWGGVIREFFELADRRIGDPEAVDREVRDELDRKRST